MSVGTRFTPRGARGSQALATRERRPGWVALGVILIVGCAALGGFLYEQAGAKSPVVVMVATVPAGHTISRTDVSTVAVAGEITAVAGSDIDSVVGQRASVTLLRNMFVQRSMLSPANAASTTQSQVGVAVASGQLPADGVEAGDTVDVLRTAQKAGDGSALPAQILVQSAVVWASRSDPAQSGGTLLTLSVPNTAVGEIVSANGAGQIAVVRVGAP